MENRRLPSNPNADVPASQPSSSGGARPSSAPESDAALDPSKGLDVLKRNRWLIVATCLLVGIGVAGYTYTLPSVYQASSLVRIDPGQASPSLSGNLLGEASVGQTRSLDGEIGVLENSLDLARQLAEEFKAADAANGSDKTYPMLAGPGGPPTVDELARQIVQKTTFTPRPGRSMIEITVESTDPEEASTIANLYAQEYKKFSRERARASVAAAREFLEQQAEEQRKKIRRLDRQWESFARENQVVEQGEGGERLADRYNELQTRRDEVAFQLKRNRTQLELLKQQLKQFRPQLQESVSQQQEVTELRNEIQALGERIAQMQAEAARYYAANPNLEGDTTRIRRNFPELNNVLQRIDALEARQAKLTDRLVSRTTEVAPSTGAGNTPIQRVADLRSRITQRELTVSQQEAQLGALDKQIAQYESKLNRIPSQRIERNQIERQLDQAEAFHETIMAELQRTAIAEESELGYVKVVQSAFVPGAPVRPNMAQNVVLGLLLGLLLGVGGAFVKEAVNTKLQRPEDVEAKGYTLLGVVPTMEPEIESVFNGHDVVEVEGHTLSTRLMPLLNPWSSVTENYRLIQTNLRNGDGIDESVLLVTSALQKEGKTVTSVNLALTAALSGRDVLFIDADMRKPTAHEALGMPRTPGLAEMLNPSGERVALPPSGNGPSMQADAYLHPTPVEGLSFVPAGQARCAPSELLDSRRMQKLVDTMQSSFDLVVIDTPPTQAASDSIVVGSHTDATALVVSADEADERALDSAMQVLAEAGVDVSGVILNRYDESKQDDADVYDASYYKAEDYYEYQEEDTEAP